MSMRQILAKGLHLASLYSGGAQLFAWQLDFLRNEFDASRRALGQCLSPPLELFCYPNGDNDSRAHALVRTHYDAAGTTVPGAVSEGDDICLLPRIPAGETGGLFVRRLYRHAA